MPTRKPVPALVKTIQDALDQQRQKAKSKAKGSWCAMFIYSPWYQGGRDYRIDYCTGYDDGTGREQKVTLAWIKEVAEDWPDGIVLPLWVPKGATLPA